METLRRAARDRGAAASLSTPPSPSPASPRRASRRSDGNWRSPSPPSTQAGPCALWTAQPGQLGARGRGAAGRPVPAPADPEGDRGADGAAAWGNRAGRLPSHVPGSRAGRRRGPRSASGPQAARRRRRPRWSRRSARPRGARASPRPLPVVTLSGVWSSQGSSELGPPAKSRDISSSVTSRPQTVF